VGTEICSQLVQLIPVLEMRNIGSIIIPLFYSVENFDHMASLFLIIKGVCESNYYTLITRCSWITFPGMFLEHEKQLLQNFNCYLFEVSFLIIFCR